MFRLAPRGRSAASVLALAVAGLAAPAAPALASEQAVTIVAGHPPVFRWVKHASQTFIPAVNAALEGSGHHITFLEQYGGALAGVGEELETVEVGLAELGLVSSLFDPSKLAIQNVTYVTPFVSPDSTKIATMMDRLQAEDPRMRASWEENNLEYLGCAIGIDDYLLMTEFPVESLADLDGRKIAAPGAAVNWLAGTGAIGVSGNLTTYYNEIKSGVYDGVIVFASAALPGKLHEVAPYITRLGFGGQYAGGMAANKDWYEEQPEAVRTALKEACAAYSEAYQSDLDAAVAGAFEVMEANGATITDASVEMREAWAAGMDNNAKQWAEQLDASGKAGTEILSLYMDAMRAAGAEPVRDWDAE
ncbi:MAG: C4-dicarboxylate TRAP transporter substrate-binding protein [Pseudomonadota bacterium]